MIEIKNLNKSFGKLQVLKDLNINLEKGQCIGLIGHNGCGKTTLIKSILGMVIPNTGSIYFRNENITGGFEYRSQIGYMPQIGRYPDNMTILQVLDMLKNIRNHSGNLDEELIYAFQLDKMYDKQMRTLSGGTTQKVSAALAFLFNPEVLILDEPTAGLDPLASEILREKIIREKENGKLILITSHLLNELDELASHIIFMQDGNIEFHLTIKELLQNTGHQRISKAIATILK